MAEVITGTCNINELPITENGAVYDCIAGTWTTTVKSGQIVDTRQSSGHTRTNLPTISIVLLISAIVCLAVVLLFLVPRLASRWWMGHA